MNESSASIPVSKVNVDIMGLIFNQQFDDFWVLIHAGQMQCVISFVGYFVDLQIGLLSALQQKLYDLFEAQAGSVMQNCPSVGVLNIDVSPTADQRFYRLEGIAFFE